MNKIFLALTVTLISLTSFAATTLPTCENGDNTCDFVPGKGGAGTNVVGASDCPGCAAMEIAGKVKTLGSTNGIYRATGSTPSNGLPAIDPLNLPGGVNTDN